MLTPWVLTTASNINSSPTPSAPPINYPGASGTILFGINGDAQSAGYCQQDDCPGFLYSQGTFLYPPVAVAHSVNNNEQVAGGTAGTILFVHEGSSTVIACPNASMTNPVFSTTDFILNAPVPPTQAKAAFVGSCVISSTGILHGFLATFPIAAPAKVRRGGSPTDRAVIDLRVPQPCGFEGAEVFLSSPNSGPGR